MANSELSISIRPATPTDVPTVFHLIQALAEYEKLSHEVVGSEEALAHHLFGPDAFVDVLLAEASISPSDAPQDAVGFALFFKTYSTYRTTPGIYLEDLFVKPEYRRQGIGKALFVELAKRTLDLGYTHMNWSVLDWNEMAIAFYQRIGAVINNECRVCRITGEPLQALAQRLTSAEENASPQPMNIHPVTPQGIIPLFQQIQSSAAFHGAPDAVVGSITDLRQHLFETPPAIEAMVADQNGTAGIATFSHTYSTFLTQPGLYLEDLFVSTDKRKQGIGSRLLSRVAQIAVERNCGRLEWLVQNWNENAIAFYQKNGATVLPDWRRCQLADQALHALARS